VITQGLVAEISGATLWRWLRADALRPWQHRSWIFPRDPDFATKAGRILDLYDRVWQGRPLQAREFVISADEKSSIQARRRKQPRWLPRLVAPPESNMSISVKAHGPIWLRGTYIEPRCLAAAKQKTALSVHRGQKAVDRLRSQWPHLLLVHTPVHACWLNQIEIYFPIVQRKVLTPNDFQSLNELEQCLLAFQRRYQETASPFQWTFTRKDLATLLAKIEKKRFAPAA